MAMVMVMVIGWCCGWTVGGMVFDLDTVSGGPDVPVMVDDCW